MTDTPRDPATGALGAHPVGVAAGGAAGAAAGAVIGSVFGPIGTLVGAALGTLGGAAGGHAVAEQVDASTEVDYWRDGAPRRDYLDREVADFERDFAPAYRYGIEARNRDPQHWHEAELTLSHGWEAARGDSTLDWAQARPAVRDAWLRTDDTYRAYAAADAHFGDRFGSADYHREGFDFADYRAAYHYGTRARAAADDGHWTDATEQRLAAGWTDARGSSRLEWEDARHAVRDAWQRFGHEKMDDATTRE